MKIVLVLAAYFIALVAVIQTGGLYSGAMPVYYALPLLTLAFTKSTKLTLLGLALGVLQIAGFHSMADQSLIFASIRHNEYFFQHILATSTLATIVATRVAWSYMRELDDANEALSESERLKAIANLANGMAHEVKNPLAVVSLKRELLQRKLAAGSFNEKEAEEAARKIREATARISEIVAKLSIVSTLEHPNEETLFDLSGVLRSFVAKRNGQLGAVQIKLIGSEKPLIVSGGLDLITKALGELVDNAEEAARNSGEEPWIRIELKKKPRAALLSITNSGKPLSNEILSKIFDPFFSTKEIGQGIGLGLGLNIARAIIEVHKGTIEYNAAYANPQFVVRLPLA